jgi:hypothetical protein
MIISPEASKTAGRGDITTGGDRRTLSLDLPLVLEITLVGDDEDGEVILVLDTKDLLMELGDFLEGVARGDGVDEEEAFAGAHVLLTHGAMKNIGRANQTVSFMLF